jgi:thiosulfate reductase cytochrome b subunit
MHLSSLTQNPRARRWLAGSLLVALAVVSLAGISQVVFARNAAKPVAQTSPLHPTFALLDSEAVSVLESGKPVSTMQTCGSCHDTEFIASHSFHSDVGLSEYSNPGQTSLAHTWDTSPGLFGEWNPLTYRYLSPEGDQRLDLSTAAWIMTLGARHVGGGPAQISREGQPLTDLAPNASNPETSILDPQTGESIPWDWQKSGTEEMNCFLCHTPTPNNEARLQALQSGEFQWASTATLLGSGLVEQQGDQFTWNPAAFDENGELQADFVKIQDPANENCGLCHGLVHDDINQPLAMAACEPTEYRTVTSGQVIAPEYISDSGMNLADKESLQRPWDIHAEREVKCTDCHYSLNNPIYYQESAETRPEHLDFDPRRLDFGEYLKQPDHQFARGQSAQDNLAPELRDTMRRCESCHNAETSHTWLPYVDRHINAVSCETCHIPQMYSSAAQQTDWTVIKANATAQTACRGIEGPPGSMNTLITGFEPVLIQRSEVDGAAKVAPYNLVTSWYWVSGNPERPVRQQDLQTAFLDGGSYSPEIVAAFDANGDGALDDSELRIDTPEKEQLVAARLAALGLENPHIVGEIQPYSINHNVATGEWAIKDCETCHSETSRLAQPFMLASYVPAGVMPTFISESNTNADGEIKVNEDGALYYQPKPSNNNLYILGHNNVMWVDLLGFLMFAGVLVGVGVHGSLRYRSNKRRPHEEAEIQAVYMYTVYERFWHWLQTFTILGLLFTGLIIHRPETFGAFSFRGVVLVHNILAVILLINAFLSLFYHLASGEIKQYIPRPYGFIDDAVAQGIYYVRGIFKGEPHPFEKTPRRKLNPLQQVTYFAILNILLPLQIITGALIWGVQHWPQLASSLGGLPFLAPFHTLIAWTFASFIVLHVYLTTTGHTPLAGIKSMMVGWDELEVHQPPTVEVSQPPTQEEAST